MNHLIYDCYCFQCCFGFANIISNSFDVRFSDDATTTILVSGIIYRFVRKCGCIVIYCGSFCVAIRVLCLLLK